MARELFSNTLKKVLPFEQKGDFFYRKAKKSIENNNYINALNYYRKALEKEPDNIEYSLDLAEVFTEMGYYNESNKILFSILHKSKTYYECYFGMGCNFLGLQEYEKAEESLEKYLEADGLGLYADEAADLLEILQNQEYYFEIIDELDDSKARQLADAAKGKIHLDRGDFKKAIRLLEKVVDSDKDLVFARNNLALAYYCVGDLEKAIHMSKEIIEESTINVHANCNLAIFHLEKGDIENSHKYIENVLDIPTEDPDELHKIVVTLCEMRQHERVNKLLKRLIQYKPYDIKILHSMAVSSFNLKLYKKALYYWNKIEKISPGNTISSYYRRLAMDLNKGSTKHMELPYHFQVPYDEIVNRVQKINDIIKSPDRELLSKWKGNRSLYNLLAWGLDINDPFIKIDILDLVASFDDRLAEGFIREYILRGNEDKSTIRHTLALLKQIDAQEPYMAMVDGDILEINVSIDNKYVFDDPKYANIPNIAIDCMMTRNIREVEDEIQAIWNQILHYWYSQGIPRIRKPEGWAAAIDLYYCLNAGISMNKKELAEYYGVSYSTLQKNYLYIEDALGRLALEDTQA